MTFNISVYSTNLQICSLAAYIGSDLKTYYNTGCSEQNVSYVWYR